MKRIVLMLLLLCSVTGCNLLNSLPDPAKPDNPPAPTPDVVEYAEQEYWNQLAKAVESGVFLNSDDICSACDKLKATGELKDLSRLDDVRKKRIEPITGDAKSRIIAALKGN